MALEMKAACARCRETLSTDGSALRCSFEYVFCTRCAVILEHRCPMCGGELARRPPRGSPSHAAHKLARFLGQMLPSVMGGPAWVSAELRLPHRRT